MRTKGKMLTPRQYADANGVAYTTVMNWLQRGKIPDAVKHDTPTGHYWEIPEKTAAPSVPAGRPKKEQQATGKKAPKK